jgi:hypothetical protein
LAFISAWGGAPFRPLHTLVRQTEERFRPVRFALHSPSVRQAQAAVLDSGAAQVADQAVIFREQGAGRVPTIVLGGFVPDATEQVFLLRRFLLKSGDVYYLHYPRDGFSLDLLCAQLSDLVAELSAAGPAPVVLAVSFGAGVVLDWLRRLRCEGHEPLLSGLVLISPVTCVADVVGPDVAAKPATLLGRALKPYLDPSTRLASTTVERSRAVFLRMFEAGAQNKSALRMLMTAAEAQRLREAVMVTIRGVTCRGAACRVQALAAMSSPTEYFLPNLLPLTRVPALILFAEREDAVLDPTAPVRLALGRAAHAYFVDPVVREVSARAGRAPVQHASLVFHVFDFLPPLRTFYRRLRRDSLALAA